jgi:hypothetical protein
MMKLTALMSVILLTTIGLIVNSPDSPQTPSHSQVRQAFGTQNWGRTIQDVNRMNGNVEVDSN